MEILTHYRSTLRPVSWLLSGLFTLLIFAWLAPPIQEIKGIAGYVPLHTFLETIAIVVSMLVFGVCWGSYDKDRTGNLILLASVFLGVAMLDFLHTLSYKGMPDFVTPGGPEKSINFWLIGRALSAFGLLAVAILPWRPLRYPAIRWLGLLATLLLVALAAWIGLMHQDWIPRTFITGQGLTPFKVMSEYVLILLFLVTALIFLYRMRTPQPYDVTGLFAAVCIMAMSEFFFTLYASVTDIFNVLGHIYKVIAYGFIYKSIFIDNIKKPYQDLQLSNLHLGNEIQQRRDAEHALNRLNEELESRVAQRTKEMQIAMEEAERANKAKSEFLSSMSHELRTPLNAILGFSQLMEIDESLSSDTRENAQEIVKAGHHLLDLINEVLDLSKIESGNIALSIEPVLVCSVAEECLRLVKTLADKRNIKISHRGLEGASVRADPLRLKQTLLNLLSNAIKYNREGGSVHLNLVLEGADRVRIRVSDTGPGIPAERMAELFQPFNRLGAENGVIEGTGIGLTITRRIVEMMGGTVDAESEVGVGSCFWIELPLESLAADEKHPTANTHTLTSEAIHTVLYIGDHPANIKLINQVLGRRHINMLSTHLAELGIELALTRQPDAILLDLNMPGMNGLQVVAALKAEPSTQHIPVIALATGALPSDIKQGMEAGFSDYLAKHIDIIRLNSVLDLHLTLKNI